MNKSFLDFKNIIISVIIFCVCFLVSFVFQKILFADSIIPVIFLLGAFLISVMTKGYIYGIMVSLLSGLMVNFAFIAPFFELNFSVAENCVITIVMILVSLVTCALTTKIKNQETIEAESEKERMRANLMRAVSHDLRTPLTTIYGSSSAILENSNEFTDEQKLKMIKGIKEDAQWLSRMVENLLSITKLDSANVKIIKTPTVLDELVDSILIKFNKRYPGQEVIVDIPDDFVVIPMDALLIEQVAINILENAVQHAKGMTELLFRVTIFNNRAVFYISDNGCGIKTERMKDIFAGSYREETTPSDGQQSNAGIGLSVCATIIKAHGGEIRAENLKRGGAAFRFSLKMEDENE